MAARRLHEFVRALRGAGVRISPVEAEEAFRAAALIGYHPREQFRETLALTLVKSEAERPDFDHCFDTFFQFEESDGEAGSEPPPAPAPDGESGESLEPAAASLLSQDGTQLEQTLAQAAAGIDFTAMQVITQQGLYARRLLMSMGMGAVDDEILRLDASPRHADRHRAEQLRDWRGGVRERALAHVQRQFELHGRAHGRALREHTLRAAPFRDLREFQQVQELVRRLARRLARSHQRRQKKARRGALDARRTLASSLRYNAVPVELHWRERRRLKAKVLVVCDVSSSVRDAARFLLQFLYAMTDVLPRVRSFAFAARFDEVTEDFDRYSPDVAVGRILDRVSGSGTDYGTMFQELEACCRGEIDRQTTVIILGDARNNDLPAGERHLADIARRARQVFWLNPEPPSRWNSGDAIMARYLPYCRDARRCASLNDLSRFTDALLRQLD
ncbi:VWA domain-containing protein [Alloalcanivorax sp. C16-2]|uniref:VWA domain-containing protein n=1 Tax=Alloalcanivorax sp. C16-2 TaxID=3390052 RepID=UPI003970870F